MAAEAASFKTSTVTTIATTMLKTTTAAPSSSIITHLSPEAIAQQLLFDHLDRSFPHGLTLAFGVSVAAVMAAGILLCGLAHGWPGILRFLSRRRRRRRKGSRRRDIFRSVAANFCATRRKDGREEEEDEEEEEENRGRERWRRGDGKRLQGVPPGCLQIDDGAGMEEGVEETRSPVVREKTRGRAQRRDGEEEVSDEGDDGDGDSDDQTAEEPLFRCGMRASSRKRERLWKQQQQLEPQPGRGLVYGYSPDLEGQTSSSSVDYFDYYYYNSYGYSYGYGYDHDYHHDYDPQRRTTRFIGIPRFMTSTTTTTTTTRSSHHGGGNRLGSPAPGIRLGVFSRLLRHVRILYSTRGQYNELQVWPTGQQQEDRGPSRRVIATAHQYSNNTSATPGVGDGRSKGARNQDEERGGSTRRIHWMEESGEMIAAYRRGQEYADRVGADVFEPAATRTTTTTRSTRKEVEPAAAMGSNKSAGARDDKREVRVATEGIIISKPRVVQLKLGSRSVINSPPPPQVRTERGKQAGG